MESKKGETHPRVFNSQRVKILKWDGQDQGLSPYTAWLRPGTYVLIFHILGEFCNHKS